MGKTSSFFLGLGAGMLTVIVLVACHTFLMTSAAA